MEAEKARIGERELMARLATGGENGITVVTPNRRLATAVRAAYDRKQSEGAATAWPSADVLPLDAWLERLWEQLLYSEDVAELPLLMSVAQEQALWDEAVRASPSHERLLAPGATAARARDTWRLAHAWRLLERARALASGEDARAFLEWAGRFERLCAQRHLLDGARLADELVRRLPPASIQEKVLVLHGFDIVAPQVRDFAAWIARCGVAVEASGADACASDARRIAFHRGADEQWAAARWARARLEANPGARIGVVVPDLSRSRDAVERIFLRVMRPGAALPGAEAVSHAFDISLGRPLAQTPPVADALAILSLLHDEVEFEVASRVVRSPFVAGAEQEASARARLDARLRERCGARVDLAILVRALGAPLFSPAPLLAERLGRLAHGWRQRARASMGASAWAGAWADALRVLGFPGERSADSTEYQALQKWNDTLAAFGSIERVGGRMKEGEALARLAHLARDTVFQAESAQAPVSLVGILESAGLSFDHLWILGMTDDAWPLPARPDPFIPVRLQREAGVPQADPAASLELDRRITRCWLGAAREVVVSHARMRGDEELSVSPLFAHLARQAPEALDVPPYPTLVEAIHARRDRERIADGEAPPIVSPLHPGGTSLFQNQSACPFRAFARNRLASQAPGMAQPGLDAAARGTLLHHVLAKFWDATRTRDALEALAPAALEERLMAAAEDAMARLRRRRPEALEGRFAAIERDRLVDLAREWLRTVDLPRDPFEVIATEAPLVVTFGGVSVKAKVDRIDRLAHAAHAVLDYKTGAAAVRSWFGPRPEEPQLPMYALTAGVPVDAIAFARVRPGHLELCGLARKAGLLPGVGPVEKNKSGGAKQYASWDALNAAWRGELDALGREFASGVARVAPKRGAATCRQCEQQLFCRIAEKRPQVEAGLFGGEDSDE
ncbi:MAG TPA: PD-(D/E)XK nuclease family protein [Usitatibacter sp.]|jgi:probable DNA repair protein|nr:PD-(D/E)XK nuclease family protein [Usitatibacter sp.]